MKRIAILSAALFVMVSVGSPATVVEAAVPTWSASPPLANPGEPITLVFCNTTTDTITVHSSAPWWIEDSVDTVFTPVALTVMIDLPPDSCMMWYWDQKDDAGNLVPPDDYRAMIEWYDVGGIDQVSSAPFRIHEGVYFEVTLDKMIDTEIIDLTLYNFTNDTLVISDEKPWYISTLWDSVHFNPGPLPATIVIPPWGTLNDSIDLLLEGIWLDPGLYKVWYRLARGVSGDPMSLSDRFAIVAAPGEPVWQVTPAVNTTNSAVVLSFTNATADTLYLPSTAPWWITDDTDNPVFVPISGMAIVPVAPGQTMSWPWPERNQSWRPVPAGAYRAWIKYGETVTPWTDLSSDFVLIDPTSPGPCVFVRTDKWFYASGEPVDIVFENCAPDTVGMRCVYAWWIMHPSGMPVYYPIVLWGLTSFASGEGFGDTWNQEHVFGGQVPDGVYYAVVAITDKLYATNEIIISPPFVIGTATGIQDGAPLSAELSQNYPNPFNPTTSISFVIDETAPVVLAIYDVSGALVRTLINNVLPAGPYTEEWDGRLNNGEAAATGVYFYRLTAGLTRLTRKAVLLK